MYNKVMIVDEDLTRRLSCQTALQTAGYDVHTYDNTLHAMHAIQQDGKYPFVMVCQRGGQTGTSKEMKRFLEIKQQNTGVKYGFVEMGISPELALYQLMKTAKVPCGDIAPDLVTAVKTEYAKITSPENPKQYKPELAHAVGF